MVITPRLPALDRLVATLKHDLTRQLRQPGQGLEPGKMLSLAVKIQSVDILRLVQALVATPEPFFYLENPQRQTAVLGYGVAQSDTINPTLLGGEQRFAATQTLIQNCLARINTLGCWDAALPGPQFFCNFTFDDRPAPSLWQDIVLPAATVLLPRWQVVRSPDRCVLIANLTFDPTSWLCEAALTDQIAAIAARVRPAVQQIYHWAQRPVALPKVRRSARPNAPLLSCSSTLQTHYLIPPSQYKAGVEQALAAIAAGQLQKIVLANGLDVRAAQPFQIAPSLQVLRQTYPGCHSFAVRQHGVIFLGATPEVLLRTGDRQLFTEALAGSAPRGQWPSQDQHFAQVLLCNAKERHEHRIVADFIVACLEQLGLTPQVPQTLALRQLSNIQHLWTPIQAAIPARVHPLEVLAQLHPTPAMAGWPRDHALAQLPHYEPFHRLGYAAPLGWVDAQGNSEFVVGIRSALIQDDRARLYAGAGIVAGSDPEQEQREVQLKLRTLLDTLV
ncbi:MAG: isochorismate synthase [Cyanobacteria bacterium P01_G01_bin.54]